MNAFSREVLPPSLRQMWSKWLVTSLPQTELCLSLFGCACLCLAVPVFVTLCLSLLGCACLCSAVPVRIGLCLSLFGCACPYWAVPVFVTLCLSLLGCACLCSAVPVRVGLCLSLLGCACLCYAVPNRVKLCWPLRVPLLFRNRILTLIPLYNSRSIKKQRQFADCQVNSENSLH